MSMYPANMIFTSESVTEGHPDKFCDQISDAVLDECLRRDPMSRVACETYVSMGMLIVGGEITTHAMFDVAKVVRELGSDIGYTSPEYGFDVNTAAVMRTIHGSARAERRRIRASTARRDRYRSRGLTDLCRRRPSESRSLRELPLSLQWRWSVLRCRRRSPPNLRRTGSRSGSPSPVRSAWQ